MITVVKSMDYVLLKSLDEDTYKDIVVSCEFLDKDALKAYIRNSKDIYIGKKVAPVKVRKGKKGEEIKTRLLTDYNDRNYILHEEVNYVRLKKTESGELVCDYIAKNINSLSKEEYIIDPNYLSKMIKLDDNTYAYEDTPRKLVRVDKNISFMTSFGEKAVCLKDSYIVIYDDDNYNTLEKTAAEYTYEIEKAD